VLGNSSSGLIEEPSFKKGTINVGDRQLGRLKAKSVIDCKPSRAEINRALEVLYSQDFQFKLTNVINPYGNGGASNKVLEVLRSIDLFELVKKKFNRLETL
jgi:GDP/UDP-N,N'-diacetylbacillosamine 2-epimerase (hydrolysing)